jgi:hypothetical protein
LSDAGGTIHAGFGSSPAGASYPPSTDASSYSWSAVNWGHVKGSDTRIGAMEEEDGEQRRRRRQGKHGRTQSGGTRNEEGDEVRGIYVSGRGKEASLLPPCNL